MSTYNYLWSNPSITVNGFKAAGILDAVVGKTDVSPPEVPCDDNPLAELTAIVYENNSNCIVVFE